MPTLGRYQRLASQNHNLARELNQPPRWQMGESAIEKGWHHGPGTLTASASFAWPPGDGATETQQMGGAETQASWAAPPSPPPTPAPPPPSPRAPRREPGRGRRLGREERGREGEEGAGLGGRWGGWGGRKRKKIFSVSPPAESVCGLGENVSDILGRSRGRAGSERPRDSPSLEPVHPPPRAPHYGEPLTLRRSNLATAGRRDLGAPRPPFLLPSPPGESDWEAVSPGPMPGSLSEVGWGGGGEEDASSVPSRLVRLSERFEVGFLPQLGGQP